MLAGEKLNGESNMHRFAKYDCRIAKRVFKLKAPLQSDGQAQAVRLSVDSVCTATDFFSKCVSNNPFLGAIGPQKKRSSKSLLLTQKWDNFHNRKPRIFSLLEIY